MKRSFSAALILVAAGCLDSNEQMALGPDPFISNFGVCYSRENVPAPWVPHQRFGDTGAYSWNAAWWDFGFIGPVAQFGMGPDPDGHIAQDNIYFEISEVNAAEPIPSGAQELIYDRNFQPSDELAPVDDFAVFRSPERLHFMLVSADNRVAGTCTPPEDNRSPNPNCAFVLLADTPGILIDIHIPRRALAQLPAIIAAAQSIEQIASVACQVGATPTFRWEPGAMHLPPYPSP